MERQSAHVPDAAQRLPLVGGHDALRRILDHQQFMATRDLHDGIHLATDARVMHGNDRPGTRRDGLFDPGLVNIQRIGSNIHENRHRTAQGKRVGG